MDVRETVTSLYHVTEDFREAIENIFLKIKEVGIKNSRKMMMMVYQIVLFST